MQRFEFKVVPAPKRGKKVRGAKGTEERFAQALEELMNEMGAQGWDYLRTDTLPVEERHGLTGRTTTFQNMLVFRRQLAEGEERAAEPRLALPPVEEPEPAPVREVPAAVEGARQEPQPPRPFPGPEPRIVETLTRPAADRPGPRLVAERGEPRRSEDGPRHPAE